MKTTVEMNAADCLMVAIALQSNAKRVLKTDHFLAIKLNSLAVTFLCAYADLIKEEAAC